jgi:hypothetical protein
MVVANSTGIACCSAVCAALALYFWWTSGGDDDTKRKLKKLKERFEGVRRTAPATS